jgi:hypothetical protein
MEDTSKFRVPEQLAELDKMAQVEQGQSPLLEKLMQQHQQNVNEMSRNDLIREVKRLNGVVDKLDVMALVGKARGQMAPGAMPIPQLQHKEAFMLMLYRSEGGTDEKLIWNSRDGVTPFTVHIDGLKYDHVIHKMQGPFFDRPEGIIGQWETRTEAKMMEAWQRTLERAVLAGRMHKDKAAAMANRPDVARSWNLNIGLRSMATGRYTDEAA